MEKVSSEDISRSDLIKYYIMGTNALCMEATRIAHEKGFHEYMPQFGVAGRDARHLLSLLMLVTTEVAEAAEEVRKGTSILEFREELADVCLRVFDIAGVLNLNLEDAILDKMAKNEKRPTRHGGKLA